MTGKPGIAAGTTWAERFDELAVSLPPTTGRGAGGTAAGPARCRRRRQGFVEPLESSALLMLVFTIMSMTPLLPTSWGLTFYEPSHA